MANETTPKYFIQVPLQELKPLGLSSTDKLVYGTIYTMLNVTGKCFMGNAAIADSLDLKPATVSKSVSKLADAGLINVRLVYKEGTKQIDKRYITLSDYYQGGMLQKSHTLCDKNDIPMLQKSKGNRLLNRLDEYKEDEEEVTAINVFIDNWKQEPNPIFKSKLVDLVSTYSDGFISECLKVAAESNVKLQSLSAYLDSLIKDLDKNKVTKAEKIKSHVENHRKISKTKKQGRRGHRRVETLPDWAKPGYKPNYRKPTQEELDECEGLVNKVTGKDTTKDYTREELEERLNNFKEKRNNE